MPFKITFWSKAWASAAWIFKHGTDIVERGLIVLLSVFFCYFLVSFSVSPLPGRGLMVLFFVALLENFLPTPLVKSVFHIYN